MITLEGIYSLILLNGKVQNQLIITWDREVTNIIRNKKLRKYQKRIFGIKKFLDITCFTPKFFCPYLERSISKIDVGSIYTVEFLEDGSMIEDFVIPNI